MEAFKMSAMLVLGLGLSAYSSPIEDFPRDTVVEGIVTPAMESGPAIMVNNMRILLYNDTVIRSPSGALKPTELRVGMMVRVEGAPMRGGLLARIVYVLER